MKRIIAIFAVALVCAGVSAQEYDVPGRVIRWNQSYCSSVKVGIDEYAAQVSVNGSNLGVSVAYASLSTQAPGEGFMGDSIRLSSDNSTLTFTTAYDKHFTRIEIRGTNKSGQNALPQGWQWDTENTFVWYGDETSVALRGNIHITDLSIVFELNHGDTVYWIPSQLPAWDMDTMYIIGESGVGEYYTDLGLGIRGDMAYTAYSKNGIVYLHGSGEDPLYGLGEDPFSFIRDFEANFRKIELHYTNNDVQLDEFTDWTIDTEKQLVVWEGNNYFVDFGGRVDFDTAVFIVDPSSVDPQYYERNDTLYVSAIPMGTLWSYATHVVLCEGITRLKKETFVSGEMQTLHCPASLRRYGYRAFAFSTHLNKVTFAENSVFQVLDHGAFQGCKALPYIELPASLNRIAVYAFDGCSNLKVVSLHSAQCTLESADAFGNCPNLQFIYVPAESVEWYKTATNWSALASKIRPLPPSWLRPGDGWDAETGTLYVFSNPETGSYAGIADIQKVSVDAAVTALADGVFANCTNLKNITVKPTACAAGNGILDGCTKLEYIFVPIPAIDAYRAAANWEEHKSQIYAQVVWDMSKTSFRLAEKDASFTQDGLTLTAKTALSFAAGNFNGKGYMEYDDDAEGTCDTAFAFSSTVADFVQIELIGVGATEADRKVTAPGWTIHGDTVVWSQSEGVDSVLFGSKARQFTSIEFVLTTKTTPVPPTPTAIEDVRRDNVQSTKVLRHGLLFIERNGRIYDAQGNLID